MADDTKSKIAELEKELYDKNFKPHATEDILRRAEPTVPSSWDAAADSAAFTQEQEKKVKQQTMVKKFAIISIYFFVAAVAIAGFIWWRGGNIISGENITIDTSSPVAVAGGEAFETKFTVANNNKVPLDSVKLYIEYPVGFYTPERTELPRITKDIGTIAVGQSVTESVNTILYGEENSQKDVSVILEYRVAGSNATLKKTSTYSVRIASSPVVLKLSMLKEASSGQEVEFTVDVGSNSKDPLDPLLLEVAYPFGFTYRSADPAPAYGTNIWNLGTMKPNDKRTIKVRGTMEGIEGEQKITRVSVGTQSARDERQIGVIYNAISESVTITKPFLGLDLSMNGSTAPEYTAPLGRSIRVDVSWKNNNPTTITDAVIEISLKGDALNRFSIYASNGGFYNSANDTVIWNRTVAPELATIEPGGHGTVSFSFSPVALGVGASSFKNPQIALSVKASAHRVSDTSALETLTTFASRTVKFDTELRLAAQSLYFAGPIKNSGPLPPRANTQTSYTIKWTVRNATNGASNVIAKTTLPIYVKWLNNISPSGEDITFNESGSEVVWNVGRVPVGGTREAYFQVGFLPSLSQLNLTPVLTGESTLMGTDDFTKSNLTDRKAAVTTYLSSDPQFSQNQSAVVQ